MNSKELIRKMMDTVSESMDTNEVETTTLTEAVHIEVDGPEADELVARLLQLSGQSMTDVEPVPMEPEPAPMPAIPLDAPLPPVDVPPPVGVEPLPTADMDLPVPTDSIEPKFDSDHFVQDDDGECVDCGMPESDCMCDEELALETAEHDHGHESVSDDGIEVDPSSYIWNATVSPQRMVKGTMGDNPMVGESETVQRFKKIVTDYVSYLNESDLPNEDGQASPLTTADRQEFDKDPHAGEEPTADGSMSPMSQIERQDVMK